MKGKILLTFILVVLFAFTSFAANRVDEGQANISFKKPGVIGLVERMDVNKINLPLRNDGKLGEDAQTWYPNGQTTKSFLFSGGFAITGYVNGEKRSSWMATASLIEEWQAGNWGMDPTDDRAKFYVVDKTDGFGSQAYVDWADAVALGADFQDLDGDGLYDPNVDRPDMLGDKIIWCPLNDNTSVTQRTPRLGTAPIGLQIHQMVWAFARADALGDVIFIRYRLINPLDTNADDVIFSVWEDPDVGDADDDLIGCDTTISMGYVYNDGDDAVYGPNPPAHGVDFFQGPIVESPGDTAYLYRGPYFGIDTLYDMKNLPMTSFMTYINGSPVLPDPDNVDIARNYQEGGLDRDGNPLIPTNWGAGATATTDPRYFYSGDPINGEGWLDITPSDKRFLVNCGPFQLAAHDTQDIVVAYVVGQGADALSSVNLLKINDITAQKAYDANFFVAGPPPSPKVSVRTFDQKIQLIIDLEANGTYDYDQSDKLLNRQVFEAIRIYQFKADNPGDNVSGVENSKVIAEFDVDNQYKTLYTRNLDGSIEKTWEGYNNLNPDNFESPGSAIFSYTIDKDVFNNDQPLINNKQYFFSVTAFSLNRPFAKTDTLGFLPPTYLLGSSADFLESPRQAVFFSATPNSSEFQPFLGEQAEYAGSKANHDGAVYAEAVIQDDVNGHEYSVDFFDNGNYWRLRDLTTNTLVMDSLFQQTNKDEIMVEGSSVDVWNFPIVSGVSVKVLNVTDILDTAVSSLNEAETWLVGDPDSPFNESAVYDNGINLVKIEKPSLSTYTKDKYFPVRLEVDTTTIATGYRYAGSFAIYRAEEQVPIKAYDMSNPDQPRQLNVTFNSQPTKPNLIFDGTQQVMIMNSDYAAQGAYSTNPDSAFRAQAYIILQLKSRIDSVANPQAFHIDITPNYPNSDVDVFTFSTGGLVRELTQQERKDALENVKVVPNPYWAYSQYETSYDAARLKFIHLDRQATIRIFNLAGQLIRTIVKNDDTNETYWDLRNESGLKVASGMYIAHIEVPNVGQKVIKFAVIQREERIDRY